VKLVVDLTNSARYYDPVDFEIHGCAHVKVPCVGKDEPPDPVAVSHFVYLVQKFIANQAAAAAAAKDATTNANPNAAAPPKLNTAGVILVHCTHGFNRTGAMLVHYMQRARKWPKLNEHVAEFARHRPPGIYKPEYLKLLFAEYLERRFSTTKDPPLPEWKRRGGLGGGGGGGEEDGTSIDAPPLEDAGASVHSSHSSPYDRVRDVHAVP
jgi:mRNA-capping enzyme